ncbi:hypothetical protein [Aromatoleum evansii]|uniref:hypothetical protein n=1 Tax=Aromatoleum evansii TaxID=59406 RepID=UPI00145D5C8C|nr:hypothetical protein [Aromatoleum evansii]NMG30065.1 hypothetical protein [Aromatoleum evansii]
MLDDLLWQELEIIKSFYARALSWAATETASQSAGLAGADEETIEQVVVHPHSPYNFEQIVIRSVINELNALCEFSLQNVWRAIEGEVLPSGELVFTASRGSIEQALLDRQIVVKDWPRWLDVLKLKELSEGFKHRQRMQPFPIELQKRGLEWRAERLVEPQNTAWLAPYELKTAHATEGISAVEELLHWLRMQYAI